MMCKPSNFANLRYITVSIYLEISIFNLLRDDCVTAKILELMQNNLWPLHNSNHFTSTITSQLSFTIKLNSKQNKK